MADAAAKNKRPTSSGNEESEFKSKISDLTYQIHALEDELSESKLIASKSNAQAMAQKSTYEIQVAELNSKLNEMEEESLIGKLCNLSTLKSTLQSTPIFTLSSLFSPPSSPPSSPISPTIPPLSSPSHLLSIPLI